MRDSNPHAVGQKGFLHLERDKGGFLFLYQRSSDGGSYDSVGDAKFAPHDSIIDYDCTALVYPKFIKIVSEVEPTYAAVVSDGEVTEIKAQTKEIEVTSNGTTEVAPDTGFAYLNSVKVKTNVATSGEGGASYRFYSIEKLETKTAVVEYVAPSFARVNGMIIPAALAFAANMWESVSAVSADTSAKLFLSGEWRSVGEILERNSSFIQGKGIVEITEEEFYTL